MSAYETWSVWLSAVLALLTAAGLAGVVLQLRQAERTRRLDHAQRRKQATVEFYAQTVEARVKWREDLPNDRDQNAIRQFLPQPDDAGSEANTVVSLYLDYFEFLATGINAGIYDFETIAHLAGPRLVKAYRNYQPWIEARRELFEEDSLYGEWLQLVVRLEEAGPAGSQLGVSRYRDDSSRDSES